MADNYPEAAGKHAEDCQVLLSASRFDGAGYLAGYAVECVLKTLIQAEGAFPRPLRHHLDRLSQEAIRLAGLPSQRTMKYVTHPSVTTLTYGMPTGWEEKLRYEAPGIVSEATANAWVGEAQRLYREVIVAMKLDGVPL
jgi:hypothetical protein